MPIEVIGQEGGLVSNNFVVDMNNTTNNTSEVGGIKESGPYQISLSSGDTSFDVYLIGLDGSTVGYSNQGSVVASAPFESVCILGVSSDETVTFTFSGSLNNPDAAGDETGAGAYLESISPNDLPGIDDTATVTGGNFATDVEIDFISGATVLPAKNITRNNSNQLIVTRPDGLIEDLAPYDLRAINPGVNPPVGSNSHLLPSEVTAGVDSVWVTTSPLNVAPPNEAFSQTLEASDSDGTIVDYSVVAGALAPGLTLNSTTGVLSGTPTTLGQYVFTVRATDNGGNTTDKEFVHDVLIARGGTVAEDSTYIYHTFETSDDLEIFSSAVSADYLLVGGGGPGAFASGQSVYTGGGGGNAGQVLTASTNLTPGTYTVGIGGSSGDTTFDTFNTANGGNEGNRPAESSTGPSGVGASGSIAGVELTQYSVPTSTGDEDHYGGGGGGGTAYQGGGAGGIGGGGRGGAAQQSRSGESGQAGTGGGGGGGGQNNFNVSGRYAGRGSGGSGLAILRYTK